MREAGFRGTERFRLLRRLGAGGMGVVYAAHDAQRDEIVALKTLLFGDAAAIYRLKKEFRALADVVHPNLISYYELFAEAEDWFFTMELIEGENFLDHVRPGRLDEARLRSTLRQLAEGLTALHEAGKLHRDLKPSNVLITPADRTVILDFGIATDLSASGGGPPPTLEQGLWGTPIYMSPERVTGAAIPASDWYSLGVMLYEALTGGLPFGGSYLQVLAAKLSGSPPRADAVVPGLPADLVALCADLLCPEVPARATGEDVLRRLGASPRASQGGLVPASGPLVVGREAHLAALDGAAGASRSGRAVIGLISGPSGSGKSTLLDAFLARLAQRDGPVILRGRCYVRETVPFKGLDGVLDDLSRWLRQLPAERQAALLTPELAYAARVFPALDRVTEIPRAPVAEVGDPIQLRRLAVAALRRLLGAVAAAAPLVLAIDDFQWGDRDGTVLLEDLMAPPEPPPLLLLVAFRSEQVAVHPFVEAFVASARSAGAREISVGPLSEEESRALAGHLIGGDDPATAAIAREAGGSPFLIELLARHSAATRDDSAPQRMSVTVAEMVARRLADLPPEASTLLETLAVAAHPLNPLVARDASGLRDERPVARALLARHLLRSGAVGEHLEVYHDRIREAILARLPPARLLESHRRLAAAMEAHGGADPETLYEHWMETGDAARAQRYAAAAAKSAADALAFERAAELYRRALDLARAAGEDAPELRAQLAHALANAGRGLEAADAYLAAAERADPVTALELRRRAADQLLRCGHVERGFATVDAVLEAVGERPSGSRARALVQLLARRSWVRLRGLGFTERPVEMLPPGTIRRLDVCWTVALGLVRMDNLRAADFQTHHLLLALRAGEPYRIARALACESAFVSLSGGPTRARCARLVAATQALAARTGNPHAIGISELSDGIVHHFFGEWAPSVAAADRAERILREQCSGVWLEIDWAQEYSMGSLYFLGDWTEVARRVPGRLREAEAHDDRYAAADLAAGRPNIVWLMRDDVDTARRMLSEHSAPWSGEAFHVPQWLSLLCGSHIDFYEGRLAEPWPRVLVQWRALRRSTLLRIQLPRLEIYDLRARCALGAALGGALSERAVLLAQAERNARRVARERMAWAMPLASLALGGVAAQRGDLESAVRHLRAAVRDSEAVSQAAHAAAARRRLGKLLGGDEGNDLVAAADSWFRSVGAVRPERLTAVLAPGFAD